MILNEEGEVKSAIQSRFSFENQDGKKEESINIYSPIVHWSYLHQSEQDSNTMLIKYHKKVLMDTLIKDGEYTFQYDKNYRMILFIQAYPSNPPFLTIDFQYDSQGRWIQITKQFRDERSGHISSEITKREFPNEENHLSEINPVFLSVNGENINDKVEKTIVDYYVLLQKAAIFIPDNAGGMFDVPNGYFKNTDDGTGGGTATSQIAIFKTNTGKNLLAINWFYMNMNSFPITSGSAPEFYLYENKTFTVQPKVFPAVNINLFFDRDTGSIEGIPYYYTLPRQGTSIGCNFGIPIDFLRENYNDYKEECDKYSDIKRNSFTLEFDRIIPGFYVKN